jgi:hypothetical protein
MSEPPTAPVTTPVTDRWAGLPLTLRERLTASGRPPAHHGTGDWEPCRPLLLTTAAVRAVTEAARTVAELAHASCRRRARTVGELRRAVGRAHDPLVLQDDLPLSRDHLTRWYRPDVLLADGVPRILEINAGSALGGTLTAHMLSEHYRSAWQPLLPGLAADSPVPGLITAAMGQITAATGPLADPTGQDTAATGRHGSGAAPPRLAIPAWNGSSLPHITSPEDLRAHLAPLAEEARSRGVDVRQDLVDDLSAGPGGLYAPDGARLDRILRLFLGEDLDHRDAVVKTLLAAVRADASVDAFGADVPTLFSSKIVLAWIWQDLPELDAAAQRAVRRFLPRTAYVGPQATRRENDREILGALAHRDDTVLKPCNGHGGTGVVLGSRTPHREWLALLEEAAGNGGAVLQERVRGDRIPVPFRERSTGRRVSALCLPVLGPFLSEDAYHGALVRHTGPHNDGAGDEILNAARGAVMNTLLRWDGNRGEDA